MIKHIYVHTSEIEAIRDIKHLDLFKRPFEYPHELYKNSCENEFGMINLGNLYIHFIIGRFRDERCPWCLSEAVYKELSFEEVHIKPIDKAIICCYECVNCHSRGPVKMLHDSFKDKPKLYEETKACLKQLYGTRKPWDAEILKRMKDQENE